MCGRYSVAVSGAALVDELKVDGAAPLFEWSPSYSVAPRTGAPVLRDRVITATAADGPDAASPDAGHRVREIGPATWGLRPSWAREKGPRPINARLESVATNGMFRSAFASARVAVPMTGYYEWQEERENGRAVKNPSYVHGAGDEVLLAAGLLASFKDDDEVWQPTFTIITRTGEDAAGEVHDRMPVFLTPAGADTWLDPTLDGKAHRVELLDLLDSDSRTVASGLLTHRVSRAVNDVRRLDRSDPALIAPLCS